MPRLTRAAAAGVMTVNTQGKVVLDWEAARRLGVFDRQLRAANLLARALREVRQSQGKGAPSSD